MPSPDSSNNHVFRSEVSQANARTGFVLLVVIANFAANMFLFREAENRRTQMLEQMTTIENVVLSKVQVLDKSEQRWLDLQKRLDRIDAKLAEHLATFEQQ